jgi:ribosomal protein S18 acetylase RimI-like enzyme
MSRLCQIRPYQLQDLPALQEITAICFEKVSIDRNIEQAFGAIGGHDWRWRKARQIEADVAGDHARGVLVAEVEGQVVGYVTCRVDPESRIGWIPNLAVIPEHQGEGVGRLLLEAALEHLRQAGMECAKIETLEQNPVGPTFYPSLGFREVARQIHYLMRL